MNKKIPYPIICVPSHCTVMMKIEHNDRTKENTQVRIPTRFVKTNYYLSIGFVYVSNTYHQG